MNPIAAEIKKIVESQGLLYFRSININDLNQQVGETDIAQGIGVYSSLPDIDNETFGLSSQVLMNYSIEVYYLKLNNFTDDKGSQVDEILDELKPYADGLYDLIKKSKLKAVNVSIDGYKTDATETLKMTKEVLTGWRVRLTFPIMRSVFDCGWRTQRLIDSDSEGLIDEDADVLVDNFQLFP